METLKQFYIMSGLKINVEKTRALWIGSSCGSHETLCEELALDWSQEPLKILGVTFSPLVFNIWDLNVNEILRKVKHLLNQWSKRKISLSGRITIIKSLAISKFVHLFISLPDPPNALIKELEHIFYKFLWNSGPDRIKRKIIVKNIACAGLRMVELRSFIKALKLSWLRRILQQSKQMEWINLSQINFQMLFSVGGSYATELNNNLYNPFWKNLMANWAEFCKILPVEKVSHMLESPIWYNENIGRGKLFIKNWYDKGIRTIQDIVAETGKFYSFDDLKAMYNINGTFLDYQHLIHSIPPVWTTELNENPVHVLENKTNVMCNVYVQKLIQTKKGSRIFYDVWVNVNEYIPQGKWQAEIGNIRENDWKLYFRNIKHWHEVQIRDFQYKINNKILVTNSFLFKINKIDSEVCSYCREQPEKIHHLFLTCPRVKAFWSDLRTWLITNVNIDLPLDDRPVLFSCSGNNELLNYIYVLAKLFIYKNKFNSRTIYIQGFINFLKKKNAQ